MCAELKECLCEGEWYTLSRVEPDRMELCTVAGTGPTGERLVRPGIYQGDGKWQSIVTNITHWMVMPSLPEESGY